MIDRTHALPITRQAAALGLSRGAVYYTPRPTSVFDLALMRRIDAVHLEMPWWGARGLRRCGRDNIFVERLWRTLKYVEVYLRAYDLVSAARTSIERYLTLYNTRRPHSSLADQTPDQADFLPLSLPVAA